MASSPVQTSSGELPAAPATSEAQPKSESTSTSVPSTASSPASSSSQTSSDQNNAADPPAEQQEGVAVAEEEDADVDLSQIEKYSGEDVSASDEEIRREMWIGVIPISITLDIQATGEAPSPYYLMASRLSYFPIVCAEVIDYFRNLFPDLPLDSEFWLAAPGLSSTSFSSASSSSTSTSNEVPLKWQYPIGVLFDMYGNPQSYPWKLILRFKDFPEQLLRCEKGVETVRWHYMQVLKEASYLKFRTKAQVHRMPLKQQRNLWQAVSTIPPHYDLFHQTIQPLAGDTIISLAIRVLQPTKSNSFKQSPVIPLNADGSEKTLKAVLQEILQTEFSPASQRVVIQGISAPLDSSIVWLSKICMHPEHFLWIVVV